MTSCRLKCASPDPWSVKIFTAPSAVSLLWPQWCTPRWQSHSQSGLNASQLWSCSPKASHFMSSRKWCATQCRHNPHGHQQTLLLATCGASQSQSACRRLCTIDLLRFHNVRICLLQNMLDKTMFFYRYSNFTIKISTTPISSSFCLHGKQRLTAEQIAPIAGLWQCRGAECWTLGATESTCWVRTTLS